MDLDANKILALIDESEDDIVRLTRRLVRIPSENKPPWGHEKHCQEFVANQLEELGLQIDEFTPDEVQGIKNHPAYYPGRDYKDRPNIVGVLKGTGAGRSIILSGHIDTVPKEPVPWRHDPFSGVVEDGKLFGRGANDMKGGIASMVSAIRCLNECGVRLKGSVIVESVVDEEFGGVNGTLACILRGYEADAAIIAEPTALAIWPTNKGATLVSIKVKGEFSGFHPQGDPTAVMINPVMKIPRVIDAIGEFANIRGEEQRKHPLYAQIKAESTIDILKLRAGQHEDNGTMSMPLSCELLAWVDCVPGEDIRKVVSELSDFIKKKTESDAWLQRNPPQVEIPVPIQVLGRIHPPSSVDINAPIMGTIRNSIRKVCGTDARVTGGLVSDLWAFNLYSRTPAIDFGPGGGNAHQADEFVMVDDLVATTKVLALTLMDWCGS